jgi:nitroreductase
MYLQTVMLLAVEAGLDTCAQEFWASLPKTVAAALDLPASEMLFCGMALGYRDADHPINSLRTRREPLETMASFHGF